MNCSIIIVACFLWWTVPHVTALCEIYDTAENRRLLKEFYSATSGSTWHNNSNWGQNGSTVCDWFGIVVLNGLSLNLTSNNLSGTLPASLSGLQLGQLILDDNTIGGALPPWNSFTVTHCWIRANLLQGTIPSEWSSWPNLVNLGLTENNLTGTLPSTFSEVRTLAYLDLGYNFFSGPLPESWSTLTQLATVIVEYNSLNGTLPDSWKSLTKVSLLKLRYNRFAGDLPSSWSNLRSLDTLYLSRNNLTGTLPSEWGNLTAVTKMLLDGNRFYGTLPESWEAWGKLLYLHANANSLTGTIPSSWSWWTTLITVDFSFNQLSGTLPPFWENCSNMEQIQLQNNMFSGTLPSSWGALHNLTILLLSNNALSGTIPPSWTSLQKLQAWSLSNNQLTGTIPPLTFMSSLRGTDLSFNQLTGSLPLLPLGMMFSGAFNLSSNKLSSTLPEAWASFGFLLGLNISHNDMGGTLPQTISWLTSLSLEHNNFTGPLPSAWWLDSFLQAVHVEGNRLGGTLPALWASMGNLQIVSLCSGQSSASYSSGLSRNAFIGSVPSSWATKPALLAAAKECRLQQPAHTQTHTLTESVRRTADIEVPVATLTRAQRAAQLAAGTSFVAACAGAVVGEVVSFDSAAALAFVATMPCGSNNNEGQASLTRFALSPFYDLGSMWSLWGNMGACAAAVLVHFGAGMIAHVVFNENGQVAVKFPSWSFMFVRRWVQGTTAMIMSGYWGRVRGPGNAPFVIMSSTVGVVALLGLLSWWWHALRRIRHHIDFVLSRRFQSVPRILRVALPIGDWQESSVKKRYGALYSSVLPPALFLQIFLAVLDMLFIAVGSIPVSCVAVNVVAGFCRWPKA